VFGKDYFMSTESEFENYGNTSTQRQSTNACGRQHANVCNNNIVLTEKIEFKRFVLPRCADHLSKIFMYVRNFKLM